jgi:hypothetical protein
MEQFENWRKSIGHYVCPICGKAVRYIGNKVKMVGDRVYDWFECYGPPECASNFRLSLDIPPCLFFFFQLFLP